MRRLFILAVGTWLTGLSITAIAELDLTNFDDDLMRTLDDTHKYLEPDINAKNAKSAREGAETIRDGLKWTEDYFAHNGGVDDGVKLAQEGQAMTRDIIEALDKGDFEKAAASARALTKNCRACHDLYKPLTSD